MTEASSRLLHGRALSGVGGELKAWELEEELPVFPAADRIEAGPNTVTATGTQSEPGLGVKTVAIGFHKPTARVLCLQDYGTIFSSPEHQRRKNKNYRIIDVPLV